ncbi:hypothetical protein GCM10029964_091710 [Kibdelosporangium lantanae]
MPSYEVNPRVYPPKAIQDLPIEAGQWVHIKEVGTKKWNCAPEGPWGKAETELSGIAGIEHPGDAGAFLVPDEPICSLVGRIGDVGKWQEIGLHPDFIATTSGMLYLTANEIPPTECPYTDDTGHPRCYSDNVGSVEISVTVTAD